MDGKPAWPNGDFSSVYNFLRKSCYLVVHTLPPLHRTPQETVFYTLLYCSILSQPGFITSWWKQMIRTRFRKREKLKTQRLYIFFSPIFSTLNLVNLIWVSVEAEKDNLNVSLVSSRSHWNGKHVLESFSEIGFIRGSSKKGMVKKKEKQQWSYFKVT